ncbi:MAG: ABC transporter ATP-binding protein [Fluviicola sp.]|nr:MAG: ABC transporter ATP-binding protein [Fluviicola sp.]
MTHNQILYIEKLTKQYKGVEEPSLKSIDLTINKGEVFGLLGPNGAGKTTLISIICGILKPTYGRVLVDGKDIYSHKDSIKELIGVVPQDIALYPMLTAKENLNYFGALYGLKGKVLEDKINYWLERLGLSHAANKRIDKFSGGMKRRINLIASVLHDPKILFLDEPTVGIDVQSRAEILEQLKIINKQGTTILYTSHHLDEAENLCTNIGIIDFGNIIAKGSPSELVKNTEEARNLEDVFLHLTKRKLRD